MEREHLIRGDERGLRGCHGCGVDGCLCLIRC
jgi:hypothetical protein